MANTPDHTPSGQRCRRHGHCSNTSPLTAAPIVKLHRMKLVISGETDACVTPSIHA